MTPKILIELRKLVVTVDRHRTGAIIVLALTTLPSVVKALAAVLPLVR